jgi:multiple antibiotic resistance protein
MSTGQDLTFLLTLVAVYSPFAAAAAYAPIIGHFDAPVRRVIAVRLTMIVAAFVIAAIWVGEFVIEVLGVSTTTLSAVGGLALLYAGVPMMRGIENVPPEDPTDLVEEFERSGQHVRWQELLIVPVAFPLSVGGSTIAISVSSASNATELSDVVELSVMAIIFAVIVGLTNYFGGSLQTTVGLTGRIVIARAAGVLLTAMGLNLFVTNVTEIVIEAGLKIG